jgi:hypothetical protein
MAAIIEGRITPTKRIMAMTGHGSLFLGPILMIIPTYPWL